MKKFLILFFCICLLSGCGSEKNAKQDSYSINYMEAKEKIVNDKNSPIIVYCKSGNRSHQALLKLQELGYSKVYDLGAMSNWTE